MQPSQIASRKDPLHAGRHGLMGLVGISLKFGFSSREKRNDLLVPATSFVFLFDLRPFFALPPPHSLELLVELSATIAFLFLAWPIGGLGIRSDSKSFPESLLLFNGGSSSRVIGATPVIFFEYVPHFRGQDCEVTCQVAVGYVAHIFLSRF